MTILNPNNTTHNIVIIPRYDVENITLILRNEETDVTEEFDLFSTYANGYMTIELEKEVKEGENFEIEVRDINVILFRGKVFCTEQTDLENYKNNTDIIRY